MAMAAALLVAACETGSTDLPDLSVHSVEVGPAGPLTLLVGDTVWLTAHPKTADGTVLGSVAIEWSLEPGQTADIAPASHGYTAVLRGLASGSTRVHVTADGRSATVDVTVEEVPVDSVAVSPDTVVLTVGAEAQLQVALFAADGSVLEGRAVSWSSASDATATVDASGRVTAQGAGAVVIRAASEGVEGEAVVIVEEPEAAAAFVVFYAHQPRMWVGQTRSLEVRVLDASGQELEGREVSWAVENTAIASVDSAGRVTTHAGGTTRVLATSGGVTGHATVKSYVHPELGVGVIFSSTLSDTSATMVGRSVPTTWTDSLGFEHDAYMIVEGGTLTLDWAATGSGYQQRLVFGTYITEDFQARRVAGTEYVDSGTIELFFELFTGEHIYRLSSSTTEGLVYWGTWSLPGELRVEQPVGSIDPEVQPYHFDMLLP